MSVTRARISEVLKRHGVKALPPVRRKLPEPAVLVEMSKTHSRGRIAQIAKLTKGAVFTGLHAAGATQAKKVPKAKRHTGGSPQKLVLTAQEIHALLKMGTTVRQIAASAGVPTAAYNRLAGAGMEQIRASAQQRIIAATFGVTPATVSQIASRARAWEASNG